MRNLWKVWLSSVLLTGAGVGFAQTPATAPAAAAAGMQTFVCKDGTSVSAATSKGACKGHKGIDTSAKSATSAAPAAKAAPTAAATTGAMATATPAAAAATKTSKAPPAPATTPAPGGGPGKVWVNENTKVYHCQGDRYYGTTKNGAYMTEADAKTKGMHAARDKACS
jgi:hypothetical protein